MLHALTRGRPLRPGLNFLCDAAFRSPAPRSRAGCDNCTKGVSIALTLRRLHRVASPLQEAGPRKPGAPVVGGPW
jgi:hypothetical protein